MNRLPDPTFDPRVADWLEDDPSLAPREVLGTVLAAFPSIEQRRASRVPWRFHPMNRYLIPLAAALIVVVGAAYLAFRPAARVGPPSTPSPAPPTIEGTWETEFTRAEMLAAGIADSLEDNTENWGHFVVSIQQGHFGSVQLSGPMAVSPPAVYTVGPNELTVTWPEESFSWTYTVTDSTATFGGDGPVWLRAKPWTRIGSPVAPSGEPLTVEAYRSAWMAICKAANQAPALPNEELWGVDRLYDPTMSPADRALSLEVGRQIAGRGAALVAQLQALNPPPNVASDHLLYIARGHGTVAIIRKEVDALAAGDLEGARALDESTSTLSGERQRFESNWGLESCS